MMAAIYLESTPNATLALLEDCSQKIRSSISTELVLCDSAWPYFEAGGMTNFSNETCKVIRQSIANNGTPDAIILAQTSMRVTTNTLGDLGVPILSSQMLATPKVLAIAASPSGNLEV